VNSPIGFPNAYPLNSDFSVDSAIQVLNNRDQFSDQYYYFNCFEGINFRRNRAGMFFWVLSKKLFISTDAIISKIPG